jgi:hypothetical protein
MFWGKPSDIVPSLSIKNATTAIAIIIIIVVIPFINNYVRLVI